MTTLKTRAELRDLIARTIGFCAIGEEERPGTEKWTFPEAQEYADAILAALDEAGLVVVPREATVEMLDASLLGMSQQGSYRNAVASSPFAKEE